MSKLSKRLQSILALVPQAECVADVGTDHGYVPIWLVEQGICRRAIAMDVREGPLQRAKAHIQEKGLAPYIETRLSDGLAALRPKEAQVIVIAGMGGNTMRQILEAGQERLEADTALILQPQSELLEFRQYLARQHYLLLAEDLVEEEGKYYPMMKVCRGNSDRLRQEANRNPAAAGQTELSGCRTELSGCRTELSGCGTELSECGTELSGCQIELMYGPLLLRQKHPVLKEFLQRQQRKQEEIAAHVRSRTLGAAGAERLVLLEQELAGIRKALELFENHRNE